MKASKIRSHRHYHSSHQEFNQTKSTENNLICLDREEIKAAELYVRRELFSIIESVALQKSIFNYENFAVRTSFFDILRLASEIKTNNGLELTVRNLFINAILESERKYLGSGFLTAALLAVGKNKFDRVEKYFFRSTENQCTKALGSYLDPESYCYELAMASIKLGGPGSKIFFKKSHNNNFLIKSFPGKMLSARVHEIFECNLKSIDLTRLIFIDGLVESIGEIDGLLQQLSKEKIACCIFAAGYSPDLVKTLDYNFKKQNLKVFPFVYSAGSSDQIHEFCSENNFSIVSTKTGSSIHSTRLSDLSTAEKILIDPGAVTISAKEGNDYFVQISMPNRFLPISGIISDRINFGKSLFESCMRYGCSKISITSLLEDFFTSSANIENSIKTVESFEKSLENLHGIIVG